MNRAAAALILGAALVVGLVGWLLFGRAGSESEPVTSPRSVVFISIDTLRADRLPAYGYTGSTTPHIDRLAADGVLFENAYAHSPQTLPSHVSILSGELPFEHTVRDNIGFTVKPDQRFLQHALTEAGYATGGFVSSYVLRRQTNFYLGFDTFDDELPPVSPEQPLAQVQRRGEDTMTAAIRWIDEQAAADRRFFLFAHIYEPHTPYTPPARFSKSDPYDGEIEYSDAILGRLLDHLRERGLYDEAMIVLFSDHGEGLGDHGEEEHGIFLYRETIRVPLIVKMPGAVGAGRRVPAPVQHVDLVPTVLEIAGVRAGSEPGRSLLPVLAGAGDLPAANIYSESLSPRYHFGWSELYALSDDRYRFIRAPKDELYDLAQDAGERRSIADDRPQVRNAMRGALDATIADTRVAAPSAVTPEDREKLAALGYVGTQTGASLELPGDALPDPKDKLHVLKMYREAQRLTGRQQYDEAIRLYGELLREDAGMIDVWLQLAQAHTARGRPRDAVAAYKEAISRDPKNPAALTGVTSALLRAGQIEEARAHAELAVEVAPAIAHEMLARIAVHQGNPGTARRHADLAQQADPTLPMRAFIDGMILHQQGHFGPAAQRLLEAKQAMTARTEQIPDLNYLAGDSLARLERYDEAERLFKEELALFPSGIRSRSSLAMVYKVTGRDADADRMVEEIVRVAPNAEGIETAAKLWSLFGESEKAAALRRRTPR